MPCIVDPPSKDEERSDAILRLLHCFQYLSKEQMQRILKDDKYISLYEIFHQPNLGKLICMACKYLTKEQIKSIKFVSPYYDLWQWYANHLIDDYCGNEGEEKQIAYDELMRLGYKKVDGGMHENILKLAFTFTNDEWNHCVSITEGALGHKQKKSKN